MTIAFVGGGNMASALIGGLIARGRHAADLVVVEPVSEQRTKLAARFPGVACAAAATAESVRVASLLVLAVKPQQMRDAARSLAPHLQGSSPVVLTIAAGIRIADLSRWLGGFARIVRAMPNTPALIGEGISGVYAPPAVDAEGRALAEGVLEAAGDVVWVPAEPMLDAVTGVSGSGPAYVFYFLEALEQAARELGFAGADARKLSVATFAGAVALVRASRDDPATLRAQVTSKGGTTERAIGTLDADGVKAKIVAAVKAAAERARELGDALGNDA